jgi:hypothetical protein
MLASYSALNQWHCNSRILTALTEQTKKLTRAFRTGQLSPFIYKETCKMTRSHSLSTMNSGAEAFETAIKAPRKWGNIGLKKLPTTWPRAANTSYKTAVSWELEESPKLKGIKIRLSICNVFQEELDKKLPEHQFKKADVKKHLKEGTGDLIPAGQLLFEQSTLYGIKSKKSGTQNPQVMQSLEIHILRNISQDIMKIEQKHRQKD